jgi:DNA-binding FadR family transcriptional regulator
VEQLKEAIARGQYGPGAKLPPERELSEVFKVSRTVVRDALTVLAGTGVIQLRQGVGAIVTEAGSQEAAQRLLNGSREWARRSLEEHTRIVVAIRSRDPEAARWAVKQHLGDVEETEVARISSIPGPLQ